MNNAVAVVGIAAELPSGQYSPVNLDYGTLSRFLLEKGEAYERIPEDRLNCDALKGNALGQVLPTHGCFLKNLDQFDHIEFGMTAKDARGMSISTRKLLELSFLSLLDSGIDYRGRNVGCYMAGVSHDPHMISGQDESLAVGSFAGVPAMIANRVSYHLDLRGPSIPLDTACSSSLTATHVAVQALIDGECEAAVVGGAQINLRPIDWLNYTQGGVLSPDGKCKPFNEAADGFGRSEGVVVVVLKTLEAARADGDRIYATILGTGINSSGSLAPVSAPVASAQEDAMVRAFSRGHWSPGDVDFIELHATGTARGDPTEANWVGKRFKRNGDVLVGSLKGNMGHLEITAFLASLCKVCLIFDSGLIPPTVNTGNLNPAILWDEFSMRVPTQVTPMPSSPAGKPSLVAMTSSGIGGANGHCLLQAPPSALDHTSRAVFWSDQASPVVLMLVGGLSSRATTVLTSQVKTDLDDANASPASLALTWGRRVRSMPWRSYGIVKEGTDVLFSDPVLVPPKLSSCLVFAFSGQGPQHLDMGRAMFESCLVFRESILAMDIIYRNITGSSLIETHGLFDHRSATSPLSDIWPIHITLPALTVVQIALVDTLRSIGLHPGAVVGHSAGETAVLYACGAASKEAAVALSIARGTGLSGLEDLECTMAAVTCSVHQANDIITSVKRERDGVLEIGCYNAKDSITLSGDSECVDLAVIKATALGLFARRLRTRTAIHSSKVEHVRDTYRRLVDDVYSRYQLSAPSIPVYSSMSGTLMEGSLMDSAYFWNNTRGAVKFDSAILAIANTYEHPNFVEIGPHPVLASYIASLSGPSAIIVCPLRRPNIKAREVNVEVTSFLDALGQLVLAGYHDLDHMLLSGQETLPAKPSSGYPFDRKSIPFMNASYEHAWFTNKRNGPLNHPQLRINSTTHPSLAQHVIGDEPIMPATGYIEAILEFGARKIWHTEFISVMALSSSRPVPLQVHLENNRWSIHTASLDTTTWPPKFNRLHANGLLTYDISPDERCPSTVDLDEIRKRCTGLDIQSLYGDMEYFAQYGTQYRRIVSVYRGSSDRDELLVRVRGTSEDLIESPNYIMHPAILDAALHITVHPSVTACEDKQSYFLPSKIREIVVHDALIQSGVPHEVYGHIVATNWTPYAILYDCVVMTPQGHSLLTLRGVEVARHGRYGSSGATRHCDITLSETNLRASGTGLPDITIDMDAELRAQPMIHHVGGVSPFTHLTFKYGSEMDFQRGIASLDPLSPRSLWITSQTGIDGDAGMGFTRSLRREYPVWNVYFTVIDTSWPADQYPAIARRLSTLDGIENETVLDATGRVLVWRIKECSAPKLQTSFEEDAPWALAEIGVCKISLLSVPEDYVIINITAASASSSSLYTFVGHAPNSAESMMGIYTGALSNVISVHVDQLLAIPPGTAAGELPALVPMAIVALALGCDTLRRPERLRRARILVTHADSPVGLAVVRLLRALSLSPQSILTGQAASRFGELAGTKAHLIISGYTEKGDIDLLKSVLDDSGELFLWDESIEGLPAILRRKPWVVGDAIRSALAVFTSSLFVESISKPLALVSVCPRPGDMVPVAGSLLFDPSKNYLLCGGLGSLGIQIALWMYENGARRLILTSRSGRDTVKRGTLISRRTIAYLESLQDLQIQLVSADATSLDAMTKLVSSVGGIAGCILLSATIQDGIFSQQTKDSFESSHGAKIGAFRILEQILPIVNMDWCIAITSAVGLIGSAGQTPYASANTALDGALQKYSNAFSIPAPLIRDSAVASSRAASQLKHLSGWASSSREFCECIGNGLRRMADGPVHLNIPDIPWDILAEANGPSPLFEHLLGQQESALAVQVGAPLLRDIVLKELDIPESAFSDDVPLTSYGLDSLSAGRLSAALRSFITIPPMSLLGTVSLNTIRTKMAEAEIELAVPSTAVHRARSTGFDWITWHTSGRTIVKVLESDDPDSVPFILLHGTSGTGMAYSTLESFLQMPLWIVQTTPETPMHSMHTLVDFYWREIKLQRPRGPYRLGAFCACSVIGLELALKFESEGDRVVQLAFLDHFPLSFCDSWACPDANTLRSGVLGEEYLAKVLDVLLKTYVYDKGYSNIGIVGELTAASRGENVRPHIQDFYRNFRGLSHVVVQYLMQTASGGTALEFQDPEGFTTALKGGLEARMRELHSPWKIYAAQTGFFTFTRDSSWEELGVQETDVVEIPGGHFSMFNEETLARKLEGDWHA